MKKVFFTALAMVAFSSASMANTIADEEIVKENKKEVKVVNKLLSTNCNLLYNLAYTLAKSEGKSDKEARRLALEAVSNCEKSQQ